MLFFFWVRSEFSIKNKVRCCLILAETVNKKYEYNTSVDTHEVAQNHVKNSKNNGLALLPHELNEHT